MHVSASALAVNAAEALKTSKTRVISLAQPSQQLIEICPGTQLAARQTSCVWFFATSHLLISYNETEAITYTFLIDFFYKLDVPQFLNNVVIRDRTKLFYLLDNLVSSPISKTFCYCARDCHQHQLQTGALEQYLDS